MSPRDKISYLNRHLGLLLKFVENVMSYRMVYRMFFLGVNHFVSCLLCRLHWNLKKPKTFKKNSQKPRFFQLWYNNIVTFVILTFDLSTAEGPLRGTSLVSAFAADWWTPRPACSNWQGMGCYEDAAAVLKRSSFSCCPPLLAVYCIHSGTSNTSLFACRRSWRISRFVVFVQGNFIFIA